ncbi:MAG: AsmA-like C-terminal region-containing protein, partial [Gammaproteobacteria bacterium]
LPGVAKGEFTLQGELERSPAGLDEFRLRSRTEIGRAKLFGTLGTGEEYAGTRASFRGEGKNLRRFAELLGLPGLKDQPFSLDLEVEALVEGWVVLDGTSLKAGDSVLTTTGTLGDRPLVSGTDLKWSLKGVDIADVARVAGLPVSFPSRQIDMSGQVIPRPADFLLRGVEGTIGLGEFSIDGQVGRKDQFRGTDLRVSARGPKLENLEFLVGDANLPEGPFQLSGRVQRTARGLRLSDSIIDVADAEGKADLDIAIPSDTLDVNFDIEIEGPDIRAIWESRYGVKFAEQDFVIDARGEVNDDKWHLEDGQIRIGKTEVDIRGDVQRNRGKLSVQANSPDIAGLGTIFGITVLPGRSLKLSGELERTGELVRLDNFLARTNKGDLAGEITFAPGSQRPRITANVTSQALDITWLTDPVTNEILYNRPEREAEERGDGRVIPDWTLPLDTLKLYDLDLSIAADEIIREDRDIRNAFIRIVAQDGALSVAPWRFEGESGTLDAEFRLTPVDANVADAEVRMEAQNLITEFFVSGQQDVSVLPKGNWDVNLKSRGSNLRELFAELDGVAKLSSSAGRVANNVTRSAIFGDLIGNITGAVNPDRDTDKFTDINCAVFPFTFDKGRMETTPSIVVQTSKLNIISQGFVDLKTESLDLSFNSKPSGGVGLSAGSVVNPFIRIGGTMADPNVTLNPAGAALTTGAAVLTLGLSVIAKAAFDAAWRSPDPCGRVLEQAEKRFAKENRRRED